MLLSHVTVRHPKYALLPAGAEAWNSDFVQPGESVFQTFTGAGEYQYFCVPRVLGGMRGGIVVEC